MAVFAKLRGAWRVYRDRQKELADETKEAVRLVYTDKLGNHWYTFADPLRIPGSRAISALVTTRRSDLNYTREDAKELANTVISNARAGDMVSACHFLYVFLDRLDWACEEKSLLDVAKSYYLINDEPQGSMSPRHQQEKDAAWAEDPDCAAFFLREAYWLTRGFSELSPRDIPRYLEERRKRMDKAPKGPPPVAPGAKPTDTVGAVK